MQTKNRPITTEELKEIKKKYNKDIFIIINGEYYLLAAPEPDPITAKIENARKIIKEYEAKNGAFDPYVILSGGETQEEKIYTAAVEFMAKVENAAEEMNEKTTYKINLF